MDIRQVKREEFGQVAQLIAQFNANPETQCIHSGEGVKAIQKQMEIWDDGGEIVFVAGWQKGEVVAVFGSEYDVEDGKGWLWGPFAADGGTAVSLYNHLLTVLPQEIKTLQSYLNVANRTGDAFYRQLGYDNPRVAHVYVALRPVEIHQPAQFAVEMKPNQAEAMGALHDATFPKTYYSGSDIAAKVGEMDKLFVVAEEDDLLGYIYAKMDEAAEEGYVEFLGVAESARGRGLGRMLLQTAVHWLFSSFPVPQIALNVDDSNDNARSLYASAGFHLHFTGVALSQEIK